jgi:hypothetical protein
MAPALAGVSGPKEGSPMRTLLLTLALFVTLAPAPAFADGAVERRIQGWLERLETDPPSRRLRLLREIREEVCGSGAGHPPKRVSERTEVLPVIAVALRDEDKEVRTQAVLTLCYMKNKATLPLLTSALTNEEGIVRYYACMGLEWIGDDPDVREPAIAALRAARDRADEPKLNVRVHAAAALVTLGASREEDVALFLQALRDPEANGSIAAHALAQLGRKEAVQLMIARVRTAFYDRYHASVALKALTGEDHGEDAEAWQRWLDANRASLPEQAQ